MSIFQCILPVRPDFIYFTVFNTASSATPQIPLCEMGAENEPGTDAEFALAGKRSNHSDVHYNVQKLYILYVQKV
jgi:hypothetical protein